MKELKKKLVKNELTQIIYDKLKSISEDEHWIFGTMMKLHNDNERREMLELINSGMIDPEDITTKALEFRGVVGIPMDGYDGDGSEILNYDEYLEELAEKNQDQAL